MSKVVNTWNQVRDNFTVITPEAVHPNLTSSPCRGQATRDTGPHAAPPLLQMSHFDPEDMTWVFC